MKHSELLAIILGRGTKKEGVLEITNRIMEDYGNKAIFNETSVEKLKELLSLNEVHAGISAIISASVEAERSFGQGGLVGKCRYAVASPWQSRTGGALVW
ncbi:MAG TPA: hypothetical protein C5S37_12960 [Methanophagales archaeon]|nr:hypothetical protein [Methanophagales archaeon]